MDKVVAKVDVHQEHETSSEPGNVPEAASEGWYGICQFDIKMNCFIILKRGVN